MGKQIIKRARMGTYQEDADVFVLGEEEGVGSLRDGSLKIGNFLLNLR